MLKTAALMQKNHHLRADAITAVEVVRMATLGGAEALGLADEIGSLTPGKRADLVLLDGNTPELAAIHDPWQQVVYCATSRCVSEVWLDGELRVRDGQLVGHDMSTLTFEARVLATDLVQRAGLGHESVLAGDGLAFASAPVKETL